MQRKSICFISPHNILYSSGGVETQVYYLAKEFAKRGWNVKIVLFNRSKEKRSRYLINNASYIEVKSNNLFHLLVKLIVNLVFKIRPNFVYIRGVSIPIYIATYFYTNLLNKKYIWALSNLEQAKNLNYGEKEIIHKPYLKKKIIHLLNKYYKEAKLHADYIFCQTQDQVRNLSSNFSISSHLVRNSHPFKKLKRKQKRFVFWSGPMVHHKNPKPFFRLVKESDVSQEFLIVSRIVNKTNNELKDDLSDIQKKWNVHYHTSVSVEKMNDFFLESSVYINTSNYEGFPNNIIQAWLHGTLVISLKLDPDKLLSNEKMGIVVQDYNELKEAVMHYLKNEEERKRITDYAYTKAVQMFDLEKNVSKIEELILST